MQESSLTYIINQNPLIILLLLVEVWIHRTSTALLQGVSKQDASEPLEHGVVRGRSARLDSPAGSGRGPGSLVISCGSRSLRSW